MYKLLVDLDVVTVALWEKEDGRKENAIKFINRIKNNEFFVITPFSLLELIAKWKYVSLKDDIEEFYIKQSKQILSNKDVDKKIEFMNIDDIKILKELEKKGVKEEDALLVLITSIFNIDYLVTLNRRHLRNKCNIIKEVLKENGLRIIKIVSPEEIWV